MCLCMVLIHSSQAAIRTSFLLEPEPPTLVAFKPTSSGMGNSVHVTTNASADSKLIADSVLLLEVPDVASIKSSATKKTKPKKWNKVQTQRSVIVSSIQSFAEEADLWTTSAAPESPVPAVVNGDMKPICWASSPLEAFSVDDEATWTIVDYQRPTYASILRKSLPEASPASPVDVAEAVEVAGTSEPSSESASASVPCYALSKQRGWVVPAGYGLSSSSITSRRPRSSWTVVGKNEKPSSRKTSGTVAFAFRFVLLVKAYPSP
jgi:hypothetical protein